MFPDVDMDSKGIDGFFYEWKKYNNGAICSRKRWTM
jgi:hypothetical protein